MNDQTYEGSTPLVRYRIPAFAVGALGLIASVAGLFLDSEQFFRSWLYGWVYWMCASLGALGLLMIQYLTSGGWGVVIRRNLEASAKVLPILSLGFIPLALGIHSVYEWSHDEVVAKDPILSQKTAYLNEPGFIIRGVIYLVLWSVLVLALTRLARNWEQDESQHTHLSIRRVSAAGLVIMGLSLTLASVDWMMSLEPHWFSTMYGFSFMVACLLPGMAIAILTLILNSHLQPLASIAKPIYFRDLGNLMFAFVMLWAYTGFSQFLLIWYGNIREEIPWYLKRSQGAWLAMTATLLILQFFVPFLLLLNRSVKEHKTRLMGVLVLIMVMRAVDLFWLIKPAFTGNHFGIHWLDIATLIGIGGIWIGLYVGMLSKRPLLPSHDPIVRQALAREAVNHG